MGRAASKDVVVVIGVGGMGAAIAHRLGGRVLLIADRDENTLRGAEEQLTRNGHKVVAQHVDVGRRDSVAALAATAAGLGRVTHVAHTAGVSPTQADTPEVLRTDLLGVALVLDAFAPVVVEGGAGVVIASMAAHLNPMPSPDEVRALAVTPTDDLLGLPFLDPAVVGDSGMAYSLAKRGAIIRTQAAAATTWAARGARVNTISPGTIATPMGELELAGPHAVNVQAMIDLSPARRPGAAEEIAEAAAFLLGPQSVFITGTDLLVDGGTVAAVAAVQAGAAVATEAPASAGSD